MAWELQAGGRSTYTGADPSVTRVAVDYERLRCYVQLFDPDIFAVQEVDGEAVLRRGVDTEVYPADILKIWPECEPRQRVRPAACNPLQSASSTGMVAKGEGMPHYEHAEHSETVPVPTRERGVVCSMCPVP